MFKKINKSFYIGNKFIFVILLTFFIPITIIFLVFFYKLKVFLIENEKHIIQTQFDWSTSQIEHTINEMMYVSSSLLLNNEIEKILKSEVNSLDINWFNNITSLENTIDSIKSNKQNNLDISIISKKNNGYNYLSMYDQNLSDTNKIIDKFVNSNNDSILINRKYEGLSNEGVITFIRDMSYYGQSQATMLISINDSIFQEIYSMYNAEYCKFFVFSNDNIIFSSNENKNDNSEKYYNSLLNLSSNTESIKINNQKFFTFTKQSNVTNLKNIVLVPESKIYDKINVFLYFVGAVFVCLLITIGIIIVISYKYTQNIYKLNKSIESYGKYGKLTKSNIKGKDEIKRLGDNFYSMQKLNQKLMERIRNEENERWKMQFKVLQAQINPHMIYNVLNSISYLAQLQNSNNIYEISSSFSHLLKMVSKHDSDFISLKNELECVKYYVKIKQYTLIWEINVEYDIAPETLNCKVLKLMIQPLVENSMNHAFSENSMFGTIKVKTFIDNNFLVLEISDNGCGIPDNVIKDIFSEEQVNNKNSNEFNSVGLKNTINRLKFNYGDNYTFFIDSNENTGTCIKISIPIEYI